MSNTAQQQPEQPIFLRASQVARRLGVGRATIYNYLRKLELDFPRGIRMGGAVVYSAAAVDAWMQKRAALSDARVMS